MKFGSVVVGIGASAFAAACCGVGARGVPVVFTGQTNVVVWEAARGVEHFVRNASFATKGKDLGFIAPTPTLPEIKEVDAQVFSTLASLEPREATGAMDDVATASRAMPGAVTVVAEQDVAGYHAITLKATDAKALEDWMGKNGYPVAAFLKGWVAPYIEKGWYLTAFKVNGGETGPVRMSFKTDRPFNPYSVPAENGNGGRVPLQLYFVSAGGETPRIGGKDAWREPTWSASLDEETSARVAQELRLKPEMMPKGARVTAYVDQEFGTPGLDDLYFVRDDSALRAGVGAGIGVAIVGALLLRRRKAVLVPRAS